MDQFPQVLLNVKVREPVDPTLGPAIREAIGDVEAQLGDRGRVVLRASGTEPLIRVMVEGEDRYQVSTLADAACGFGSHGFRPHRLKSHAPAAALDVKARRGPSSPFVPSCPGHSPAIAAPWRCASAGPPLSSRPRVAPPALSPVASVIRMSRKPLIAGNWKMNGSLDESRKLVDVLRAGVGTGRAKPTCCSAPRTCTSVAVKAWLAGSSIAAWRPGCRGPPGQRRLHRRSLGRDARRRWLSAT